jgi:hypothetical protein
VLANEDVARIAHGANMAYQYILGDGTPSLPWNSVDEWLADGTVNAVRVIREGLAAGLPEDQVCEIVHEIWVVSRKELGWVHGEEKDYESKTHPCLVHWADLPDYQKLKTGMMYDIVKRFT